MEPIIVILPPFVEALPPGEHQLLLQIGEQELYISVLHKEGHVVLAHLAIHHFNDWQESTWTQAWLMLEEKYPWLMRTWNKVFIFYQQGESTLIPATWFQTWYKEKIMETLFGLQSDTMVFSDLIPEASIYNLYQVPRWLHGRVLRHFKTGECWHQRTPELREMFRQKTEECIKVAFYPNRFVITLFQEGQLKLGQTYNYTSPEDVTYQLLQLVHQYDMDVERIPVLLQGMIDRSSGVYKEVEKYFLEVSCETGGDTWRLSSGFEEYPAHYFTAVLTAAACV
jgi:hypothetical protein